MIYYFCKLTFQAMIFTIDAGNTRTKLAIFEQNSIKKQVTFDNEDLEKKILLFFSDYPPLPRVILSSVINIDPAVMLWLKENTDLLVIDQHSHMPFANNYKTPTTLGIDRMVLAAGATILYPKSNKLIIDAGTCITFDFIDAQNKYQGGAISPGFNLRFKSLNDYTAKLPLVQLDNTHNLIGNDTQSAIQSGVINGVIAEIDGIIDQYKSDYQHLTIILTGGDTLFLAKRLKNIIFANSTFLLESLNLLYQYTIENGKKNIS